MKIIMTKARDFDLRKRAKTFKKMHKLQGIEAENHIKIFHSLLDEAKKRVDTDPEWAMICCLEALRNIEHKESHYKMIEIYKVLK